MAGDWNVPSFVHGKIISIKNLYERFYEIYSHCLLATPFSAALNLFSGEKIETSKNALSKVYYNLTSIKWIMYWFLCQM